MARVRKYQNGGDVNDLLKMLNAHGSAAPKDKELLSSLASESTQPSGYTAPVLPEEKKIDLIPKPLTNEEMFGTITPMYEGQNPNTAWMYGAMNNMPPSVAKKWRDENPGTSPEGINMMGVLGAAGYASLGVVIPGTSNIVGGVTIGDALNAYFFKEGVEGGIKHIPEFIDDPSWSGANDIAWDALKVLPGMQGLKNNVLKPFVDAYKKAKKASTAASTATSSPLQQLAGNTQKALPAVNVSKVNSVIQRSQDIASKNKYLNCEGFCNEMIGGKSFKESFSKLTDTSVENFKVGDIISFGDKSNPRHYAVYAGEGKVVEIEQWGAQPRTTTVQANLDDYEGIAAVYREKAAQDPLQQLAGNKPKVKGKGKEAYEHVNTYDKSNVATSSNSAGSQEIRGLEKYTINEQISIIKESIAKLKEPPVTQPPALLAKNLEGLERDLKLALEYKAGAGLNSGVYQYPSFMTGSKIQGQVSKDGTIARSTLEQLVKNTNTKKSEALAVESTLSEFEGNRILYSDFKKALSSSIQPAVVTTTPKYANVGVKKLGYKNVDLNIEETVFQDEFTNGQREFMEAPSTKTSLYNDPAFPSSTKHFEDPNSFWIRSLVSKIEPEVFHFLETQTDVPSLKGQWDTRTIPASEEINVFLTENGIGMRGQVGNQSLPDPSRNMNSQKHYILTEIKRIKDGTVQGWEVEVLQTKIDRALPIINNPDQLIGRIDRNKTVDQVVLEMRESVKNLKAEIKNIEKKHADNLVLYEQALEMFPNALKNSPALAKQKRDAKGMPLRFINEALLDAGRSGQTILRMPTSETVHTIEGWNGVPREGMTEEAIRKLKESQATITKGYTNFPKLWKNEFGTEVRNIQGPKGNTWYEVDVPKKFFQNDISKPAEIKTYKQGGALKGLIKK